MAFRTLYKRPGQIGGIETTVYFQFLGFVRQRTLDAQSGHKTCDQSAVLLFCTLDLKSTGGNVTFAIDTVTDTDLQRQDVRTGQLQQQISDLLEPACMELHGDGINAISI
jgi:hypothetical protein